MTTSNSHSDDAAQPYRSRSLPPRNVFCSCGHTGLDHHHVGSQCWANLPRTIQPDGMWSAVRVCACAKFKAIP
ncbi:hypothetical protein [Streptomyces sp. NPDC059802]|uniref:hypothetical protein n=1 Tax=Streptomyces sp. NPDC059802 TaxID=3346952 RepID=UPI00365880FE